MNALETLIKEMILHDGPISLDRYMALALAHPDHGAYTSRMPLGKEGDFITAPEISQMFGELIGLWAVEVWHGMGRPANVRLVELGPGRGTLIADALRASKVAPDFLAALDLHLVETSEVLRRHQARALESSGVTAHWHSAIEEVPAGPMIAIANEFFDCLPVRHYVSDAGFWRERLIGLDSEGHLGFGLSAEPELGLGTAAEAGAILEIGVAARRGLPASRRRKRPMLANSRCRPSSRACSNIAPASTRRAIARSPRRMTCWKPGNAVPGR